MHPRMMARLHGVEADRRAELYQSLDSLLLTVGTACEEAGLSYAAVLGDQRETLARIAAADDLRTDYLLQFATKIAEDARSVLMLIESLTVAWREQADEIAQCDLAWDTSLQVFRLVQKRPGSS